MKLVTKSQIGALTRLIATVEKRPPAAQVLFFAEEMVGRTIENLNQITYEEWVKIRSDAYPNWESDDWTLAPEYRTWLGIVLGKYKAHIGQLSLWGDDA